MCTPLYKPRCRWWYFWKLKLYLLLKSERDIEETWREILTGLWIGAGLQCGDCLLVFLQGGHSNYWRQTRRTIYCFPRCHWTTLPLFALFGLKIQLLYQQISWVLGWNVLLNKKQSVGHPSYVHIYATYEFEHVCHPILASGTRSAPKSAFSRPVWILGGAAVS